MQPKGRALDRALRSLAMRDHSEREIVDKLTRAGYDEREIAEAMAALAQHNLVNDEAFARQWTSARARRGLGPRRIAWELREKGIQSETRDAALAEIDEDAMLEAATALAAQHLRRGDENAKRRALAALSRRGYGYDTAKQAIQRALSIIEAP